MFNTTRLLDQLNSQFGWVSRLANITQNDDRPLRVTTVSHHGVDFCVCSILICMLPPCIGEFREG